MKDSDRKSTFVYSAFEFFPDALMELGRAISAGQDQHIRDNGETQSPQWDRTKSNQHMQSMARHMVDYAKGVEIDTDGTYHLSKIVWRALAQLQMDIENNSKTKKK